MPHILFIPQNRLVVAHDHTPSHDSAAFLMFHSIFIITQTHLHDAWATPDRSTPVTKRPAHPHPHTPAQPQSPTEPVTSQLSHKSHPQATFCGLPAVSCRLSPTPTHTQRTTQSEARRVPRPSQRHTLTRPARTTHPFFKIHLQSLAGAS